MSKQTLPESSKKPKETAPKTRAARGRVYRRQTARVDERRDGKPLLFGWGKHLSRRQKLTIQKRTFWAFILIAALAVVSTIGYAIYNINYRIPGEPIVTVNGHQIPQSLFRSMNFYVAQDLANQLAALGAQVTAAQQLASSTNQADQIKGQQELNDLQTQQNTLQAQDNIPAVGSTSVENLIEDELIREQIPVLESQGVPAATLEASDKDITAQLDAFKKALPHTTTYAQFLSASKLSENDFRQILAIIVRHNKMTQYQQSLVGPTMPQVHASMIQAVTQSDADKFLTKLQGSKTLPSDFAALAKRSSHDPNSKSKGGDLGWVIYGGTLGNGGVDPVAERWLFDPSRKSGDLSPVIKVSSTEYDIFYISALDPHRPVSASALQSLKDNALSHWVAALKSLPQTTLTDPDSNKLLDASNFPANLPSGASTSPGAIPGGPNGP